MKRTRILIKLERAYLCKEVEGMEDLSILLGCKVRFISYLFRLSSGSSFEAKAFGLSIVLILKEVGKARSGTTI